MFIAQTMQAFFKRQKQKGVKGICTNLLAIFLWPLDFIRGITIPFSEDENWSRVRAAILPSTQLLAFFYYFGLLDSEDPEEGDEGM